MSVCVLHFLAQSSKRSVERINETTGIGSLSYRTAVLSLVAICDIGHLFERRDFFTGRQMFSDICFAAVTDRRTVPASGTDPYTSANRNGGVHLCSGSGGSVERGVVANS